VTTEINAALLRLTRRADQSDPVNLVQTFVDVGPLLALLTSRDHQLLYGRRGTGKTHALTYLAESKRHEATEQAILIDLRSIGSSGGLYADSNLPLTERGTRLLVDTLAAIHDQLTDYALEGAYSGETSGQALSLLDQLADSIARVRVVGPVEVESHRQSETSEQANAALAVGMQGPSLSLQSTSGGRILKESTVRESGVTRHSIHFAAVQQLLSRTLIALGLERLWILLDEWSSIPQELQPLLADLLRRCILPISNVTVKIAAIEQRSRFKEVLANRDYMGIEVGSDMSADLDLDDFMVFGNDRGRARAFFAELLAKHVNAQLSDSRQDMNGDRFVRDAFTQESAFSELVQAAEGVPRDAINIAIISAQRADENLIGVPTVRSAAKTWYQRDKESGANANTDAHDLLIWIIDEVIA